MEQRRTEMQMSAKSTDFKTKSEYIYEKGASPSAGEKSKGQHSRVLKELSQGYLRRTRRPCPGGRRRREELRVAAAKGDSAARTGVRRADRGRRAPGGDGPGGEVVLVVVVLAVSVGAAAAGPP